MAEPADDVVVLTIEQLQELLKEAVSLLTSAEAAIRIIHELLDLRRTHG